MKNGLKEIIKKIVISICLLISIIFGFILINKDVNNYIDNMKTYYTTQTNDISISKNRKVDIAQNNRSNITNRGSYTRRNNSWYEVYLIYINDELFAKIEDLEQSKKIVNKIKEDTTLTNVEIKKDYSYISDYTDKDKLNDKIDKIIEENKKPETFYPTESKYISSYYGNRSLGWHSGIDIAGNNGDNIYAYKDGKVISACYSGAYGNMILIEHEDGMTTRYAHLSSILISTGEYVSGGSIIGYMGSTGRSTGNHLHFEVIINGDTVNPYNYIF